MLATGLKQFPSAVDQMFLPDVWELFEHWDLWPPEHVLLRGFTGYMPVKAATQEMDPGAAAGLAKMLGAPQKAPQHILELMQWADVMNKKLGVNFGES